LSENSKRLLNITLHLNLFKAYKELLIYISISYLRILKYKNIYFMTTQKATKKVLFILAIALTALIYSCKNENKEAENNTSVENSVNDKATNTDAETNENVTLNPAHGQPNHRCDIPVGAPLNSPKTTPIIESTSSPVLMNTNSTSTNTAALNPAHGQPNHRCDIPVGAPLNQ